MRFYVYMVGGFLVWTTLILSVVQFHEREKHMIESKKALVDAGHNPLDVICMYAVFYTDRFGRDTPETIMCKDRFTNAK